MEGGRAIERGRGCVRGGEVDWVEYDGGRRAGGGPAASPAEAFVAGGDALGAGGERGGVGYGP